MDRLNRSSPPLCLSNPASSARLWTDFVSTDCYAETLAVTAIDTEKNCSFCGSGLQAKKHVLLPFDGDNNLEWSNLFISCTDCAQYKDGRWFTDLLKPDHAGYETRRYFYFDMATGKLLVHNILINEWGTTDQSARVTINTFRLNRPALCLDRKSMLDDLTDGAMSQLAEFRFLKELV